VDIYLPGCPPRPEMLLHAILKLHAKIAEMPLGVNREEAVREAEAAALAVASTRPSPMASPVLQIGGPRR
jgi:NADH-quinone oxidoreductase subunit B